MGIAHKAISAKFLNLIIRTNHGQTEIVMQYGDLRGSVTASHRRRIEPINRWIKACVMLFHSCTSASRNLVFPVNFNGGEHVYRVHPINVQLVTDPVIMPDKGEHGCDSGSENFDKHEPRDVTSCIFMLKT